MRKNSVLTSITLPPIMDEIRVHLPAVDSYLVGGAIRDALLGRPIYDLDFALRGNGIEAAKTVARALGAAFYPLDSERGVGRVILVREKTRYTLDFASLRGNDILEDLSGRDFRINAIALPLAHLGTRIDPLSGERDLRQGILRACSSGAIAEDPVRAIRAVRLASQLDLRMDDVTQEQARAGAAGLEHVSAERIRDEFFRILAGQRVAAALRLLTALGLLAKIVPETAGLEKAQQPPPHRYDVWTHTLLAIEKLEGLIDLLACNSDKATPGTNGMDFVLLRLGRYRALLSEYLTRPISDDRPTRGLIFFAALLHDAGKPESRSVNSAGEIHFLGHEQLGEEWAWRRATALRFSNDEAGFLGHIVRHHTRPLLLQSGGDVTRRAVFRYFRSTGPSGVAVSLFSLADTLATYGPDLPPACWQSAVDLAQTLLEGYFERAAEVLHPAPLLSGNDLIRQYGLAPGPQIGELLDALREAQAAGEVTTREEALALVSRGLGRRGD